MPILKVNSTIFQLSVYAPILCANDREKEKFCGLQLLTISLSKNDITVRSDRNARVDHGVATINSIIGEYGMGSSMPVEKAFAMMKSSNFLLLMLASGIVKKHVTWNSSDV
ncbi:unnamed protein product [Dracunculus medinensis]|uniref:Transposase n=1 Tax=Dracunculus medinensis TaxID=318479 RepID=A0A0N4U9G9_DRAME|nr:unnamed protein product [Dracunculus medinensis]